MMSNFFLAFGLVLTAFLIAMAVVVAIMLYRSTNRGGGDVALLAPPSSSIYLFKNKVLIDATPMARDLLQGASRMDSDWDRMIARLLPLFPNLLAALEDSAQGGHQLLHSAQGITPALILRIEVNQGVTRISLGAADQSERSSLMDLGSEVALQEELEDLRHVVVDMPIPAWREDSTGQILWANTAYVNLVMENTEQNTILTWPLPVLFAREPGVTRLQLTPEGYDPRWFDLVDYEMGNDQKMTYALPVDEMIKAEKTLKDFTQTMTRTFAQLPTGIAIFDANRVLQIFNPALSDLTGLAVSFLVARPTMAMFLDALRERNMIPEPRDYTTWRRQMVEMTGAALSGVLQEKWNLRSGQTFRIAAMLQPNDSISFLMEDITEDMTNMRRMRSELAVGQSVIESLQEAVVVLSRNGDLALSNALARQIWALHLPEHQERAGLLEHWRKSCALSTLWDELAVFTGTFGPRTAFERDIQLRDGRSFRVRVSPIHGGASMVKFTAIEHYYAQAVEAV